MGLFGASCRSSWVSLGLSRASFGLSWVALGLLLGLSGASFGLSWVAVGLPFVTLFTSLGPLVAALGSLLAYPGLPLDSLGLLLGCSWASLGLSRASFGLFLGCCWASLCVPLCASWPKRRQGSSTVLQENFKVGQESPEGAKATFQKCLVRVFFGVRFWILFRTLLGKASWMHGLSKTRISLGTSFKDVVSPRLCSRARKERTRRKAGV